jgi:polysaccharide pyruvyl transferase WcaK-like protein
VRSGKIRGGRVRVFTCSWGQLESGGSNVGDEAIFVSQARDIIPLGAELGVMSAMPEATSRLFGAKAFDVSHGRLRAMLRGIFWSDIVIVGGGELVQDVSSLLYTPWNLLPLKIAWALGRGTFAWSVGIGQGDELASWTPPALRRWLGRCRGITVRDMPSLETLLGIGLSTTRVRLASDSTFTLAKGFDSGPVESDVLGFAPRNVSNRQRRLLPLETRRKLGIHVDSDTSVEQRAWAELLDDHLRRHGGRILMFPFHAGSLSNSDDDECRAVASYMKGSEAVRIVSGENLSGFMELMAGCRVFVSVPLHGSILSVVTGALPVALPYASKGFRFMDAAGLGELCVDPQSCDWTEAMSRTLEKAWSHTGFVWKRLSEQRDQLIRQSRLNRDHFRATCLC